MQLKFVFFEDINFCTFFFESKFINRIWCLFGEDTDHGRRAFIKIINVMLYGSVY
jgi:hypothetical protein